MQNWIISEFPGKCSRWAGLLGAPPHRQLSERRKRLGTAASLRRDAGPAGPHQLVLQEPPHCQMPDAARAAVLVAPVASGPSWEAVAHAPVCSNSAATQASAVPGKDSGHHTFAATASSLCTMGQPFSKDCVRGSQSHQAEPLLTTLPAHCIAWFGCLQEGI